IILGGAAALGAWELLTIPRQWVHGQVSAWLEPTNQAAKYWEWKADALLVPDIGALIDVAIRFPGLRASCNYGLQMHGANFLGEFGGGQGRFGRIHKKKCHELWRAVREMHKEVPGAGEVTHAWRRGLLGDDDARARLTRAGADVDAYTLARDWGLERPGVTQVVEAWRRGFIGDDLYKRLITEAGSRPELWETYVQSITEVPSVLDVQLGRNRGIIQADEYRELLSRHGFTLDRNKDILDALRQNIPSLSDLLRMGVRQLFSPEIVGAYGLYQEFPETMRPWYAALGLDWPLNFNVPTEKGNVQ